MLNTAVIEVVLVTVAAARRHCGGQTLPCKTSLLAGTLQYLALLWWGHTQGTARISVPWMPVHAKYAPAGPPILLEMGLLKEPMLHTLATMVLI